MQREEGERLIWQHLGCRPYCIDPDRQRYRVFYRDHLLYFTLSSSEAIEEIRGYWSGDTYQPSMEGQSPIDDFSCFPEIEGADDEDLWDGGDFESLPHAIQFLRREFRGTDYQHNFPNEDSPEIVRVLVLVRPRHDNLDEWEAEFEFRVEVVTEGPGELLTFVRDGQNDLLMARQFIRQEMPVEVLLDQFQDRHPDLQEHLEQYLQQHRPT